MSYRDAPPRIGTSGWSFGHWKDDFYAGVPQRRWLEHAAACFTGLELNATFRRSPEESTVIRWREQTPDGFAFSIKGHRYITHNKKLREVADSVARLREDTEILGDRRSAVFWQLPPDLKRDDARLADFLDVLAEEWSDLPHAFEFRDPSWHRDATLNLLEEAGASNVISDAADWPRWDAVCGPLAYVRLHGHEETYVSAYGEKALATWVGRAWNWLAEGRQLHIYLDNDKSGAAPHDARLLMRRLKLEGCGEAA
ncbi:MAG: DUF72 domain-containing protein [Gammaproteobacteria bacterium]|nr:DUF72 domain-containing protein [Gammaproteobacteria bacterium]